MMASLLGGVSNTHTDKVLSKVRKETRLAKVLMQLDLVFNLVD